MIEQTITLNLLRYAVGRAVFCPECRRILDTPTAVLVTPKGEHGATYCACAECHDKALGRLRGVDHAAFVARHDVYDGRELA